MSSRFLLLVLVLTFLKCRYGGATNETAIFFLGDSLYDPGNNNYLNITAYKANFPPYGETFFEYPTGRYCDGCQVTDFIAMRPGLPMWYAFLTNESSQYIEYGANFASAGAAVLAETNPGTVRMLF